MRKLLSKSDWNRRFHSADFNRSTQVTVWTIGHGCLCTVKKVGGMHVLENGSYSAANSLLAKLLAEAGVSGDVIVYTNAVIPQNTSRWLTWWLSTEPTYDDPMLSALTVTTLGQTPTKDLPFQVNVINPAVIRSDMVSSYIASNSKNPSVSQFIVELDGDAYRMEPTRMIEAKIIDCTERGYVLRTSTNYTFLTNMVSRRVQGQLKAQNLRPEDLIGSTVKVDYTMFTEGKRLCNFKSPIVYRCTDLDNLCTDTVPPYDGPFLFKRRGYVNSALLTATRCGRSLIQQQGDVIVGCDVESDLQLFRFGRDVEAGCYVATLEKHGVSERWCFESDMAIDALDPEGFIRCVEPNLLSATGYTLKDIRLNYIDRTETPMLN